MGATKLRFPQGTSRSFLLRFPRFDGEMETLSGASFAAYIKRSVFDADADALVDISARILPLDFIGGTAVLSFFPADTADLDPFVNNEWQVRVELGDGRILAFEEHQGPLVFPPLSGDPDIAEPPNDYIEAISPTDMANYVFNRYDLTGLTGGTSTKLDGLSAATLASYPDGTKVTLAFTGGIDVVYRIRPRDPSSEAEVSAANGGFKIICDNDTTRLWELCSVHKGGVPCVWNPDTVKWHQQLAYGSGTAVGESIAQEADAFSLPA